MREIPSNTVKNVAEVKLLCLLTTSANQLFLAFSKKKLKIQSPFLLTSLLLPLQELLILDPSFIK